ncbi:hypothetical protein EJ110_NYTH21192 [Nymphaea thermarum]|nr:hypothetical protein EJ110_NYTH21192 [Nymphaea thermarum]
MEKPALIPQKIVILNTASKIAQGWVKSMSGGAYEDKPCEEEMKGRPSRLGLGAKFVPHSKVAASCNPVERKLQRKLESEKKRVDDLENSNAVDEIEEDDLDSRANAFAKRRSSFSMSDMESKLVHKSGKRKRK